MKQNIILTTFFALLSIAINAQVERTDINRKIAKNQFDASLVDQIINYVQTENQFDTAIVYAVKANEIAKIIKDENSILKTKYTIASLYHLQGQFKVALTLVDKCLSEPPTLFFDNYKYKFIKLKADCHRDLLELELAETNYFQSLDIAKQKNEQHFLSKLYDAIGQLYDIKNDNQKAMQYYLLSYDNDKLLNDINGQSVSCCNIAITYSRLLDWDQSIAYAQKAIDIDPKGVGFQPFNALFDAYQAKNEFSKAEFNIQKAIDMATKNSETYALSSLYYNQAVLYFKFNQSKKGLVALNLAEKFASINSDFMRVYLKRGTAQLDQNNNADAKSSLIKALQYLEPNEEPELKKDLYEKLFYAYDRSNNPKLGIYYLQKAYALADTIFNVQQSEQARTMEQKFQNKEKQTIIEKNTLQLKYGKIFLAVLSFGALLLCYLIYVLYNRNKDKAALNILLKENTEQLTHQNKTLTDNFQNYKTENTKEDFADKTIILTNQNKTVVHLKDLIYIKSDRNYVTVFTTDGGEHIDWLSLKEYEKFLVPTGLFIRTHRSYLVNRMHVTNQLANELIVTNKHIVKIGNTTKKEIHNWLNNG